jgi:hypothetical protein
VGLQEAAVEEDEISKAMKARRAFFGFLPIIALVLGYQEVFISQAKTDGGSIIRPTRTEGAATAAANSLIADGLFEGQSDAFFELLRDLAEDADEAGRRGR